MLNEEFLRDLERKGLKARYSRYEYEGTDYERKHINRVLSMDDAVWDKYLELTKRMEEAQGVVWDIVQEALDAGLDTTNACCYYEIEKPENEIEVTYTETEDEWIDRCIELDKA